VADAGRGPDAPPAGHAVGWPRVLGVAALVVVVVLAAALGTGLLPIEAQRIVFHSPLLIGILVLGTVGVLWRIARHGS
jgi:uncharacterized membrane protein